MTINIGKLANVGVKEGTNIICIGSNHTLDSNSRATGNQSIAIGSSGFSTMAARTSGHNAIAIGSASETKNGAIATNNNSIAIGQCISSHADSIVIGSTGSSTKSNQLVIGSISSVCIGNGVTSPSPVSTTYTASSGEGLNIEGGSITIAGGCGTGTKSGGSVFISTSSGNISGTTLNELQQRVEITPEGWIKIFYTSLPEKNPAGGGYLFVDTADGALKFRGSSGTITTIAPA